jgi:hypothetical protein
VTEPGPATKYGSNGRWLGLLEKLSTSRRLVVLAAALGLALRLGAAPAWGTQDVEWWKAWSTRVVHFGMRNVYGSESDAKIIARFTEGESYRKIRRATQTKIRYYQTVDYDQTEYELVQPPLYIYSLSASAWVYSLFSPSLENNRWYNFALNFPPIIYSALLSLFIGRAAGRFLSPNLAVPAALLYWLNPLVILNSPVQGYQDPLCVLFGTAAIIALYDRRLTLSVVLFTLSTLTKPQGVLVLPVLVLVGLVEHGVRANLRAWLAGIGTGVLVALPFILMNRFWSVIIGVSTIVQASTDLSRQALNLWWPVQYVENGRDLLAGGYDIWTVLLGRNHRLLHDRSIERFLLERHVDAGSAGFLLLGTFTAVNLWSLRKRVRTDRLAMISAAAIQIYGYFMLRAGAQINHYFPLVPLLTVVALRSRADFRHYVVLCTLFLAQDLIFYGLGRDLTGLRKVLTSTPFGFVTVLLALAALFYLRSWIAREFFGVETETQRGSRLASGA